MTHLRSMLVIDDDPVIGQFLSRLGAGLDLRCDVTTTAERFLELLRPETSLIFLDLLVPGIDGIQLLRLLSERRCTTPIIIMSGIDRRVLETAERLAKALDLRVIGRLQKPFRLAQVETILQEFRRNALLTPDSHPAGAAIADCDLVRAIENDELVVHYQPQVDLCTDEVIGFEALVRWQRTPQTLVFPDAFIPRVEALGLMDRLGWLVHRKGLSELEHFARAGSPLPTLSVNVTTSSLLDLDLPDTLESLAEEHGIDPERVIVEVTEGGLFKDLSKVLDVLARLRMKRFPISIDDFGTGYAMMQHLRYIPATEIKIDQSFVRNMQVCKSDRIVVEKTVEIGHELGMRVVAEGVETEQQLEFLREIGCDIVQGFYFSKPLAPEPLQIWLSNYRSAAGCELMLRKAVDGAFIENGLWAASGPVGILR
jgi:EAL domain-containing protein (putative c-di-GMP-specific phosphodiesterase class I)/ActR/RegA family two-component response regulator